MGDGAETDCERRPEKRCRIEREDNGIRAQGRHDSPPQRPDDKDGHYVFELGENLSPRFKIIGKMGEGTFGRVLECWDRQDKEFVAIKVVRNVRKYRAAAMIEIDVLKTLARHDKAGKRPCLRFKTWFDYRNHVCLVCERLGPSLYDFLRKNHHRPFSVDLVRDFARQILDAVGYMHELSITHTDLKPENVLLNSSEYIKVLDKTRNESSDPRKCYKKIPVSSAVRVIDFGSATFETQHHCSVVSTRQYRAPEVILGIGWSYPCDLWSIGCILVELCIGEPLFRTHENLEHLAMMERVLGPIPQAMVTSASEDAGKYFRDGGRVDWPPRRGNASRESIDAVTRSHRLRNLIMEYVDHSAELLTDLLQGLLNYDPSARLTAKEALKHDFFRCK